MGKNYICLPSLSYFCPKKEWQSIKQEKQAKFLKALQSAPSSDFQVNTSKKFGSSLAYYPVKKLW